MRRKLGLVLQDTQLFMGTIRDNIRYGKPDAKVLLQGRNDNTGQFEPSQAHVKFGAKTGQVLK